VPNEAAEDVVVVQTPVHYAVVVVSLRGSENALVVVRELHEIDAVPLAVVSVHFLASFQVIETDTEVFAASNEELSVVRNVYRVDFFLLWKTRN